MAQAVLEFPVALDRPRFAIGETVKIRLANWCCEDIYSDPKEIVDLVKTRSGYLYVVEGSSKFYAEHLLEPID